MASSPRRGLGSNPGRGHRAVFLGKTLDSHSASLLGVTLRWTSIPSRGGGGG